MTAPARQHPLRREDAPAVTRPRAVRRQYRSPSHGRGGVRPQPLCPRRNRRHRSRAGARRRRARGAHRPRSAIQRSGWIVRYWHPSIRNGLQSSWRPTRSGSSASRSPSSSRSTAIAPRILRSWLTSITGRCRRSRHRECDCGGGDASHPEWSGKCRRRVRAPQWRCSRALQTGRLHRTRTAPFSFARQAPSPSKLAAPLRISISSASS